MLEQALKTALLAAVCASTAGAFAGALLLAGADLFRTASADERPGPAVRVQAGAFLLAAHVTAAATLLVVPKVGACVAAALGSGWIGAAAGSLVLLAGAERGLLRRLLAATFQAAVGVSLWSPLWMFLKVLRAHALPGVVA